MINYISKNRGQAIIEFTFCMIIILLMLYGLAKIFIWTGEDPAERRISHDRVLRDGTISPLQQINPDFHVPVKMDPVWGN